MSTPLLPRGWTDLSLETNVVSRLFTSRSCTHDGKFKNCTTCRDRQLAFPCIEVSFADGQLVGVSFELSKQWTGDDASRELAEDWGSPTGRLSSPVSAVCWDTHDTKADLVMRGKEAGRKAGTMVLLIRQGVAGICPAPAARASVIKTRAIPKGNAEYIDAKKYPAEARAHSIEGLIRVRLVVDSSGVVTSATLLTHLGYGLDELALKYAARIRFEPAKDTDDKPVTSVVVWTFHMSLPR
jgi:TonB family protein